MYILVLRQKVFSVLKGEKRWKIRIKFWACAKTRPRRRSKAAYKELVKNIHPDKYVNNPLAGFVAEKLKEINEAYDTITKGGLQSSSSSSSSGSGNGGYDFNTIRAYINSGRVIEAERMLMSMSNRNGEWNYLMGGYISAPRLVWTMRVLICKTPLIWSP